MVKYREILRLFKQGISQRNIAASCQCSRNTVSRVLQRAKDLQLSWEQCEDKTALEIAQLLFPKASRDASRKYPDLAYVHKELQRQGVSLKLLWQEYGEACRSSQQTPLMYSQFCHHYQQYAWKHRATLHIPRKPGEQIEVDWAGKTGCLMNRETGAQSQYISLWGYFLTANMLMWKLFSLEALKTGFWLMSICFSISEGWLG